MTSAIIADLIVVGILVGFVLYGSFRGLLRSLAGLLATIIAFVGAGFLARTLTEPCTDYMMPLVQEQLTVQLNNAMKNSPVQIPETASPDRLLDALGIDSAARDTLANQATKTIRDTGVSAAMAVIRSLAESILYGVLYAISFILLTLILKFLLKTLKFMIKLPVLGTIDRVGGGILGLLEGALFIFLAVWILRWTGTSFDTAPLSDTHVLQFFSAQISSIPGLHR